MRYVLQQKGGLNEWFDTSVAFNSKKELDAYIGKERVDYEYRVGYYFKHWDKPVQRFIHGSGINLGKEVKV